MLKVDNTSKEITTRIAIWISVLWLICDNVLSVNLRKCLNTI